MAEGQYDAAPRVSANAFRGFYVYTHARPDGSVFYVGKGRGRRAWDFSPTRRTAHHRNIVEKYGLLAIRVEVYPAASEDDAFAEERRLIAELKASGIALINLTDGGEGVSGRLMTDASRAALERGRGRSRVYAGPGFDRFLEAGRQVNSWFGSPEHKAAAPDMAKRGSATRLAKPPRQFACLACGVEFLTKGVRIGCCSKLCQQRFRRAKEKATRVPSAPRMNSNNTSGEAGVYFNAHSGVWVAMICVERKLVYLGRFSEKEDAIRARREAQEAKLRGSWPP